MPLTLERGAGGELTADLDEETATMELGARLASVLHGGLKLYLSGELGAGKTTLVRGMLGALGYQGRVKSPTFALVELYKVSRLDLYHFDFYRFENSKEWVDAGFRDAFGTSAVCVVEWPERASSELPPADLHIRLDYANGGRRARLSADTDEGRHCLELLTI